MRQLASCLSALLLLAPSLVWATTWGATTVKDPIRPRAHCEVSEPQSFGSYIYHWPEKFDQVFWPLTESNGLWSCSTSGFVAFIGDFDGLSEAEVERIRAFLHSDEGKAGKVDELPARLDRLEQIYALREKDAHFRTVLLRVLAFHHENALDAPARAADYRRKALGLMRERLAESALEPLQRLEYLFVCAAYERWFGDVAASDAWVSQLDEAMAAHDEGEHADYIEYLSKLKQEIPRITPGGKLAPAGQGD